MAQDILASGRPAIATLPSRVVTAASTNNTLVKGAPGNVYGWVFYNTTASAKFVKLYNKATAPVIATDATLIVTTIQVPATGQAFVSFMPQGIGFSAGIGYVVTGAAADADTTVTAAGDVTGVLLYA